MKIILKIILTTVFCPIFTVQSCKVANFNRIELFPSFIVSKCFSFTTIERAVLNEEADDRTNLVPNIPPLGYFLTNKSSSTNTVCGDSPYQYNKQHQLVFMSNMTIIKQENTNFHLQLPKPKVCTLNINQDKIKFKCICKIVIQEKHDSPIYIHEIFAYKSNTKYSTI